MNNEVLLVNDMPSTGKVALSASIPIFSKMGFFVQNLPTAIISNPLNFNYVSILDTTGFMEETLDIWSKLDFKFPNIITGFVLNNKQVELIYKLVDKNNSRLIVDPIMGDNGKLYNGISSSRINIMDSLCNKAEIITPNMTEAFLLAGITKDIPKEVNSSDIEKIINVLKTKYHSSIVITSVYLRDKNSHVIVGFDKDEKEIFYIPYTYINGHFGGTGDIFTAILSSNYINGLSLKESINKAKDFISLILQKQCISNSSNPGLFFEKYIDEL